MELSLVSSENATVLPRVAIHFLICAGFMLVMRETQVICRCSGYSPDGNGNNIKDKHNLAMLTMIRRFEAKETSGKTEVVE